MFIPRREPAVVIATLVALGQAIAIYLTGDVAISSDLLYPVATFITGFLIRRKVVATARLEDHHIDPDTLYKTLR